MSPIFPKLSGCLRERPFRLLFIGQGASVLGDAMATIAIAFAVIDVTGSKADLGRVLMARTIPLVILLILGGVIADRLPRRALMLGSDLTRFACQAALAALLFSGNATIAWMMALMAVYGTAEALFRPALSGLTPQTVSAPRLQEAMALLGMTPAVGLATGAVLGGVIVAALQPAGAIALDAATFAVSAVCLVRMDASTRVVATPSTFLSDLREGWTAFRSRSWLVVVSIGETLYSLFVMPAIFVLGPFIADERLGGATAWATIIASFGVGLLAGGLVATRIRPRRPLVVAYLVTLPFPLWLVLLAIGAPLWTLVGACILAGGVIAVSQALLETTITRNVPAELRSRASSYRLLGSLSCQPLGFALVGPIAAGIGTSLALWLGAGAALANIALVVGTPSVRAIRSPAENFE